MMRRRVLAAALTAALLLAAAPRSVAAQNTALRAEVEALKARVTALAADVRQLVLTPVTTGTSTSAELLTGTIAWAVQKNITGVGTLVSGATGTGFTIALGASTVTGDLPFTNITQIATASVLGRNTAGVGDIEVLSTLPTGVQDNITRLGTIVTDFHTATDSGVVPIFDTVAITVRRHNGTVGSPTAVLSGQAIARFLGNAYGATGYSTKADGGLEVRAAENWTDTAQGDRVQLWTTPIGSVTPALRWTVENTGDLLAATDNTYDVGSSGTSRPRNIYVGTNVIAGGKIGAGISPTITIHGKDASATSTTFGANIIASFAANASGADSSVQLSDGVTYATQFGAKAGQFYLMQSGGAPTFVHDALSTNTLLGGTTNPAIGTFGQIFSVGTALSGMVANTAGLYAKDVAGTARMFGIDEADVTGALVMASGVLTSGRVALVGTNGLIGDDADLTFVTDTLTVTKLKPTSPQVTAGSGTGVTVNDAGQVRRTVYSVTVDRTQFISASTTHDITIATLPAKARLVGVVADLTTTFACTATCTTATLSMTLGSAAGGAQYLVSFDADAAAARFGLLDADLGTSLARASAIQGGDLPSWTGTTPVSLRLTSGTGNLGTGAATNLSQGSITLYLTAEVYQ